MGVKGSKRARRLEARQRWYDENVIGGKPRHGRNSNGEFTDASHLRGVHHRPGSLNK